MISPEILGYPKKMDPTDTSEEKVAMTKLIQEATALVDSAGLCIFTSFGLWGDDYRDLLNSFFGWDLSTEEYIKIGERIWNAERIFNLEAGLKAEEDTLPPRMINEPMPEGPYKGQTSKVKEMMPVYYKLRGWNPDGTVSDAKKQELGL
jgi:aldehyde:ferredoxin oxidoreductase